MSYFFATFILMLVVIMIMAIGVMFGRYAIKGSCGGVNSGGCVCIKKCAKKQKMDAEKDQINANIKPIS